MWLKYRAVTVAHLVAQVQKCYSNLTQVGLNQLLMLRNIATILMPRKPLNIIAPSIKIVN